MEYSEKQLEEIGKMASIFLPITDMAFIIGVKPEQLRMDIANESSEVSKAYHKAKAATKMRLQMQEMQLAMVGSPLALETTAQNLLAMEDDE